MKKALLSIEELFNRVFTPRYNPMYFLGAVALFLLWVLFVSGIYLFIFYKISAPYESIRVVTEEQFRIGAVVRGVHRYAADALVFFAILHMAREFVKGRFRGFRWVAWVTGVGTLLVIFATGVIGYILVWDQKSQLIAELTAKFLDFVPIFGESLSIAFTDPSLITGMFFFISIFLHVTLPVLLLIAVWVHLVRISRPVINPPRAAGAAIVSALIALSVIRPASLLPEADVAKVLARVGIDWFYLFPFPVINAWPSGLSWAVLGVTVILLSLIPWLPPLKRPEVASISSEACTGCERCHEECPYAAILMKPRDEGPYELEAEVISERCSSCGICYGSCAFDAVDFPAAGSLKEEVIELLEGKGAPEVICFACSHVSGDADLPGVRVFRVPCAGMINPSIIELAIDEGVKGVIVLACSPGDCHFRTGDRWIEERLFPGTRYPALGDEYRGRVLFHRSSVLRKEDILEGLGAFAEGLEKDERKYA